MLDALFALARDLLFLFGYVRSGGSFPSPLSPDEERRALDALAAGDAEAREQLIEHNLRLVAHIAKKYASPRRDMDDIISIGTVGLIKAVSTFNGAKGGSLATYASRCIENEILMSLRAEKKLAGEVSLSEPIGTDKDGNCIELREVLGCDADALHDEAELNIAAGQLYTAMGGALSRRERTIVELRYGLCGAKPMAQREVAEILGISRSYVSRLEKKALIHLRTALYPKLP